MNALELANILETDEYPSDKALEKSAAELRRLFVELDEATRINKRIFADNQLLYHNNAELVKDKERLDWLDSNFFNRENLDWDGNLSKDKWKWVFFAPIGVQSDIRLVLDAALEKEEQ
jgi:hypothetical protein